MTKKFWNKEEMQKLTQSISENQSVKAISSALGRSSNSVERKANAIGYSAKNGKFYKRESQPTTHKESSASNGKYMVLVSNGSVPTNMHHSLKDAIDEAVKQARQNPHAIVSILSLIKQVKGVVTIQEIRL